MTAPVDDSFFQLELNMASSDHYIMLRAETVLHSVYNETYFITDATTT